MPILTFRGGVHPKKDGKELSKGKAVCEFLPEGEIVIPMSQHIGSPSSPLVKPGERVLMYQKIGESTGFISANIHSSVSGTVKKIEDRYITGGGKSTCIVIENDNMYEKGELYPPIDPDSAKNDDIIERIKEAGITGMGGAGFPTHVKLSPKDPDSIEYIIINGAECEPYITADYRRMMESPELIIEGLNIILSMFKNAKGIIAIEDNKLDAFIKLKNLAKKESRIEVKKVYTKYPQGGERTLIYALTGRSINSSMLPADENCIVNNIDTVIGVYNAVISGIPLVNRIVTVSGEGVKYPGNFLVPFGTAVEELIKKCEPETEKIKKIISGGPMMGIALHDTTVPIVKNTSAILCFTEDDVKDNESSNCINCGRCAQVCPGQIIPARLATLSEFNNEEEFLKQGGMECCDCGCCSYICPAKKNLTQSIKTMRKTLLTKRKR